MANKLTEVSKMNNCEAMKFLNYVDHTQTSYNNFNKLQKFVADKQFSLLSTRINPKRKNVSNIYC